MSISIGTSTPPTTRDTHAAWLRRRAEDQRFDSAASTGRESGTDRWERQPALV